MSKKMKVLVAVLAAVLVLTVGGTAVVMAQEEEPPPETEANGLLARVAEILGISQEELASAFKEARQEMRQEAFERFLEKAVAKERITQQEADDILEWWEQRPEALDRLLLRARIHQAIRSRQTQQQGIGLMLCSPILERQMEHQREHQREQRGWHQTAPPWQAE